jgi:hypothetical protein
LSEGIVARSGEDQLNMVMHMDQDRVRLNGKNGHNGHKNLEDLHGHLLSEYQTADIQTQTRKVDYARLLELGRELLVAIGEDPNRRMLQ